MASSNIGPSGPGGRKLEIKHGEWLKEAWELQKEDLGDFLQIGLIAWLFVLLCGIPYVVLGGPLTAGLLYFGLKKMRRESTEFNDLFFGFKHHFVNALVIFLIGFLVVAIPTAIANWTPFFGRMLAGVVGLALGGCAVLIVHFALLLLLEGGRDAVGCLTQAFEIFKREPVNLFLYGLIALMINMLGSIPCGLGLIVTLPLTALMMTIAYREVTAQLSEKDPVGENPEQP